MNKGEFIKVMSTKLGVTQKQAGEFVDTFWDTVVEATLEHGELKFIGTGNFVRVDKEAKEGRNPKTGETIQIEASTSIKFKAGKSLKKIK